MTHPFVKWAGGKRQLAPAILARLPKTIETYYEPFVGGGAIFLALDQDRYQRAVLNDVNTELMAAYRVLADADLAKKLVKLLKKYPFEGEFYLKMRAKKPKKDPEIAARLIYLNKTGFNGLYRVNQKGEFNVPMGAYTNPTICDEGNLLSMPEALAKASFSCEDFEQAVAPAKDGDAVYFDPPYIPKSETSNFTAYTAGGFGLEQHQRLARTFRALAEKGVSVLLSNSDVPRVHELYEGLKIETVEARRSINSKGAHRGPVTELLISANL